MHRHSPRFSIALCAAAAAVAACFAPPVDARLDHTLGAAVRADPAAPAPELPLEPLQLRRAEALLEIADPRRPGILIEVSADQDATPEPGTDRLYTGLVRTRAARSANIVVVENGRVFFRHDGGPALARRPEPEVPRAEETPADRPVVAPLQADMAPPRPAIAPLAPPAAAAAVAAPPAVVFEPTPPARRIPAARPVPPVQATQPRALTALQASENRDLENAGAPVVAFIDQPLRTLRPEPDARLPSPLPRHTPLPTERLRPESAVLRMDLAVAAGSDIATSGTSLDQGALDFAEVSGSTERAQPAATWIVDLFDGGEAPAFAQGPDIHGVVALDTLAEAGEWLVLTPARVRAGNASAALLGR